ncbi:hypothetical protein PISMIDRAFT_17323, partial [Pisolithus microcarpus 441]
YLEDVAEHGKAQGITDTLSLGQLAIDGAPPRVGRLWTYLVASASILEQWDWENFKALVTLQYPEIEPIEDVREYFDEFYAFLDGSRCSELSSVPALGAYLRHFQVLFLAMVTRNALELSHRAQLFLRGLPPQVELEVSRRLASRYPLFMSGHLWPIEVIVRITKEVIEDRVGHLPPCLASKKPSSSLESPEEPAQHSHSPSISYWPDAPVEYSRSRSRRCSQGSSSSKPPSCSPFEATPRTSKNSPHPPELASSSSSPHRVTIAGSGHVQPHRCDPGWQAGDSPSNSLRSSREDRQSHLRTVGGLDHSKVCSPRLETASSKPRDLGSTSTRPLRPCEPSSTPSKCYSCFEASSKSFDLEPLHRTSFLLREAAAPTARPAPTTSESCSRVSSEASPLRDLEGILFVSSVVEKGMFGLGARSAVREEIPREVLGRTLQARLDFWALAHGPGSPAVQVKSPPSSSKSSPPLFCPRGDLETTPERLSSSRASTPPSRQAPVEFRGSSQPLEGSFPPLEPLLPLQVQHPLRVAFRGLSRLEASLVFEATPPNPLDAPRCHSGTLA